MYSMISYRRVTYGITLSSAHIIPYSRIFGLKPEFGNSCKNLIK
jgi:hypothetical protein